jgi:hypothetical protein
MTAARDSEGQELVVAPDGSIPAEQVARLGVEPGAHLRVVSEPGQARGSSIAGRLTWPDLPWEDFERASLLARADVHRA